MPATGSNFDRWAQAVIGETISVAYTSTHGRVDTSSMTISNKHSLFRIVTSTDSHVRQGNSAVVATTSDMPLYIGQEAWALVAGDNDTPWENDEYFSAVQQASGGNLYVTNTTRNG